MKKIEKADPYYVEPRLEKNQQVFRIYVDGGRLYYTIDSQGNPKFYLSLTTMLSRLIPKSQQIIEWMANLGLDKAKEHMNRRAEYGTLMHYAFGKLLMEQHWDFDNCESFIDKSISEGVVDGKYREKDWEDEINHDVASFAQFIYDYKVQPKAIELVLVSEHGYGTAIDLVCTMHISEKGLDFDNPYKTGKRKGQPREVKIEKEVTALINFKSGRKGFYEEHEVQLEFERLVFEENYPNIKVDAIYNWSPKEWITTPSYNLKDQSDSLNREKARLYLGLARIDLMNKLSSRVMPKGVVKVGEAPIVHRTDIEAEVRRRSSQYTANIQTEQ